MVGKTLDVVTAPADNGFAEEMSVHSSKKGRLKPDFDCLLSKLPDSRHYWSMQDQSVTCEAIGDQLAFEY